MSKLFSKLVFLFVAATVMVAADNVVFGQDTTYTDPNVDYTFTLPDPKWRQTGDKPTSPASTVRLIYGDRMDGMLEVRRVTVAAGKMLSEIIEEEEQRERFKNSFVAGREENFNGRLRGSIFNYEFVGSGRTFAGRAYFLRSNDTTVYILKFVGEKDSLRSIRSQLDAIARSFAVKQAQS